MTKQYANGKTRENRLGANKTHHRIRSRWSRRTRLLSLEPLEDRRLLVFGDLIHTIKDPSSVPQDFNYYGTSVATQGPLLAVGAPSADLAGQNVVGAVFLHDVGDGRLRLTIPNPTPAFGDKFGQSVSLSGNLLVVGAPGDDVGATDAGVVHVYDATTGVRIRTIANPTPIAGDQFGASVAISGNTIVVGASFADQSGSDAGIAYVFDAASGQRLATLTSPAPSAQAYFGSAVAISGDNVVVGAYRDDTGGTNTGAAYLYRTSGALLRSIPNPSPGFEEYFGYSVGVSGSRIVIGARADNTSGPGAGTAYLFDVVNGSYLATLHNPTPARDDDFGISVSISGDRVVVGAFGDDTASLNAGAAYVFDATTANLLQTIVRPPSGVTTTSFGNAVAASSGTIVVGSPSESLGNENSGAVYLYDPNAPLPRATLSNPARNNDGFGASVALDTGRMAVGAVSHNTGTVLAGAAYLYDVPSGALLRTYANPAPTSGASYDRFGYAVAVRGSTTVVSAPYEDYESLGAYDAGTVYLFDEQTGGLSLTLTNPSPRSNELFGHALSVADGLLVVGAPGAYNAAGTTPVGEVYVYDLSNGQLIRALSNPSPANGDEFGYSVAISGGLIAVGARRDDAAQFDIGAVHVFNAQTGALLRTINNPSPATSDMFGTAVALGNGLLAVGSPLDDNGLTDSGSVFVFDAVSGALLGPLSAPTPAPGDYFGASLAIAGGRIVVGASLKDVNAVDSGAAYLYDASTRVLSRTLSGFNPGPSGLMGNSVAAHVDAVAVGVSGYDRNLFWNSGAALVFGELNSAPTNLSISNNTVAENQAAGSSVGILSTTDPDAGNTFTYTLVSGSGSNNNSDFNIVGNQLVTAGPLNYEAGGTRQVRIRTTDQGGLSFERSFVINVLNVRETFTWSGVSVDNLWSRGDNWVGGFAPSPGEDLVFDSSEPGVSRFSSSNDFVDFAFGSITISDSSGNDFQLGGNSLALVDGITFTGSANNSRVALPSIRLEAPQAITNSATGGTPAISSSIDTNGHLLTVAALGGGYSALNGPIVGSGGFTKSGSGVVQLTASNTYRGLTTISDGAITLLSAGTLGDLTSGTVIEAGASLIITEHVSGPVLESITASGNGLNNWGAIAGERAELAGNVTLVGDVTIGVLSSPSSFTLSGDISDGGAGYGITANMFSDPNRALVLAGQNTYSGQTLVADGTLAVTGTVGASTISLLGGSLAGTGTSSAVTTSGGTVAPGGSPNSSNIAPGPGILNTGSVVFNSGSNFNVELNGTTVGTEYDQLHVTGSVNLNDVNLNIARGFTPAKGDVFTIIDNDGTDSVVGEFSGLGEGAVVTVGGRPLVISYRGGDGNDVTLTAVPATVSWDGGGADDNWMTAANWVGDVAPNAGDHLVFTGSTRTVNTNGFAVGTDFASITFQAGGFVLRGNAVTLTPDGRPVISNASGGNALQFPIVLGANSSFAIPSGYVGISGAINNGGHLLTVDNSSPQVSRISGVISGTGGLTKTGTAQLILDAPNTFTGLTTIAGGAINLVSSGSLGSATGGVLVNNGATLNILNTVPVLDDIAVSGIGFTGFGAITGTDGAVLAGNVTLLGNTRIGKFNRSAPFTISGSINDGGAGYGLEIRGSEVERVLVFLGANSYSGATTTLEPVTLRLGAAAVIPDGSAVSLATGSVLDLNSFSETVGSLAGSGNVQLASGTLTTGGNDATTTFSGAISGSGNLTKTGSRTFTLTGSNSFTGLTTITQGVLAISNANALGTAAGATAVEAGAVLEVSNFTTIAEPLILNGGTVRSAAASNAPTFTGGATLNADSFLQATPGYDDLDFQTGPITGPGGLTILGGQVRLHSANSYAGVTRILSGGHIIFHNAAALGSTAGGTEVAPGASL